MDGDTRPGIPGGPPNGHPVNGTAQHGLFQGTRKDGPGIVRINGPNIHRKLGRIYPTPVQQQEQALWPDTVHGPTPGRTARGVFFDRTHKDQQAMTTTRQTFHIYNRRGCLLAMHVCETTEQAQAAAQSKYPNRQTFVRPSGSRWAT
jgi:hypothetical protein